MTAFCRTGALALAAILLIAVGQAWAGPYPNYIGTNFTYTQMQETPNAGDPDPLWGAPTGVGNNLLFFPSSFRASSLNGSPNPDDAVGSNFQAKITQNTALDVITEIKITEFGDIQIPIASAATSTFASMTLFVTPITCALPPCGLTRSVSATFTPTDFVTAQGTTLWSATASIDLSDIQATEVNIAINNDLYAFSESGTSSAIQKKAVNGPTIIIEVIPEPGTALLVGIGLTCLGVRARRQRAA